MKTYTTAQAAKITKRSPSVIARLVKESKLKGVKGKSKTGRPTYIITVDAPAAPNSGRTERDVLIDTVHGLVPKGGYHKNVAPKKGKKSTTPMRLDQVLTFLEFSDEKRSLLLQLGAKATDETLEVLFGLV